MPQWDISGLVRSPEGERVVLVRLSHGEESSAGANSISWRRNRPETVMSATARSAAHSRHAELSSLNVRTLN